MITIIPINLFKRVLKDSISTLECSDLVIILEKRYAIVWKDRFGRPRIIRKDEIPKLIEKLVGQNP